MFCKNCGAQIDDDSKFCTVCGNTISQTAGVANNQSQQPVNSNHNTISYPNANTNTYTNTNASARTNAYANTNANLKSNVQQKPSTTGDTNNEVLWIIIDIVSYICVLVSGFVMVTGIYTGRKLNWKGFTILAIGIIGLFAVYAHKKNKK